MHVTSGELSLNVNKNLINKLLRMFIPTVSVFRVRVSTQIHTPRQASMRALSNKMSSDRTDGHCCGFVWI